MSEGGAITAFQSEVVLYGLCKFKNNYAVSGGAIHATESQVYIIGNTIISNNTAKENGGGVLLYHSELNCQGNSTLLLLGNVAREKGGALHAISSSIKTTFISTCIYWLSAKINFVENYADEGGAVSLEVNAKLYIFIKVINISMEVNSTLIAPLTFTGNKANYGGGIYVADDTNFGTCASTSFRNLSSNTECFLQVLNLGGSLAARYTYVNFTNNIGIVSGAALYGGLLDRCTVSPFAEIYSVSNESAQSQKQIFSIIDGVKYFEIYSTIKLRSISSEPVRICFCNKGHPDCDYELPPIRKKKGERFEVAVVAVDQIGNPLSSVNILSSLSSNLGGLL